MLADPSPMKWERNPVSLSQISQNSSVTAGHALTLFALLFYVREAKNPSAHVKRVQRWLVFQCWPKISSRLRTSQKEWRDDPIVTFRGAPAVRVSNLNDETGLQLDRFTAKPLSSLPQNDGKCYVNETTASLWFKAIGDLVVYMRERLPDEFSTNVPTSTDLIHVDRALAALQAILSHKPVRKLFLNAQFAKPFVSQVQVTAGELGIFRPCTLRLRMIVRA
jgi:hypothetical protein